MSESNFDVVKIKKLMTDATLSLTGEPVQINLWAPIVKNRTGQVYRAENGRFAFDIKPNLSLEVFYECWLHETCHILLGHCTDMLPRKMPPEFEPAYATYKTNGPFLEPTAADEEEYENDIQELEARTETGLLDSIAKRYARMWFDTEDIEARIRALTKIMYVKGE